MTYDPDEADPRFLNILEEYLRSPLARIRQLILNPPGGSPESIEWNRNRYLQLQAQAQRELQVARKKVADWTGTAMSAAAKKGWLAGQRQLQFLNWKARGIDPALNASFANFNMNTVRSLALATYKDADGALDATGRRIAGTLRKMADNGLTAADVNRIIAKRVIEGKPAAAIRDIAADLEKLHGETITFASGTTMQIGGRNGYARMLARTRLREAAVSGRHSRLVKDGVDHVVIIGNVTIYPCTRYLGKIYCIGESDGKYPSIEDVDGPPFHPNCSKTTAPIVPDLATREQIEQGQPNEDSRTPFVELKPMSPKGMVRVYERQANIVDSIREKARRNGYNPPPWAPTEKDLQQGSEGWQ